MHIKISTIFTMIFSHCNCSADGGGGGGAGRDELEAQQQTFKDQRFPEVGHRNS